MPGPYRGCQNCYSRAVETHFTRKPNCSRNCFDTSNFLLLTCKAQLHQGLYTSEWPMGFHHPKQFCCVLLQSTTIRQRYSTSNARSPHTGTFCCYQSECQRGMLVDLHRIDSIRFANITPPQMFYSIRDIQACKSNRACDLRVQV